MARGAETWNLTWQSENGMLGNSSIFPFFHFTFYIFPGAV